MNNSDKEKVDCILNLMAPEAKVMENIVLASVEGKKNPIGVSYDKEKDILILSVPHDSGCTTMQMDLQGAAGLTVSLKASIDKMIELVDSQNCNEDFSDEFSEECQEIEVELIVVKSDGVFSSLSEEEDLQPPISDSSVSEKKCDCPACHEEMLEESSNRICDALESISKNIQECGDEESKAKAIQAVKLLGKASDIAAKASESGLLDNYEMEEMRMEYEKVMIDSIQRTEALLKAKPKKIETIIDFEKLRETFVKFGPQAAKETLMRIPADKRDQVTAELMSFLAKK